MDVFKDYAYYYNAFYREKDYAMEAGQVDVLLRKYGSNINKIINFGCGTGRHDIELAQMGYQCTGVDMSFLMIDTARENVKNKNIDINFSVADIRNYKPIEKYDAVISLFHVMSYQNTNEDIINVFKTAAKALNKDGLFMFDIWYGPGVLSDKPIVRVKEVEDCKYKLVRIAKPILHDKINVVDVCYDILIIDKATNKTEVINEVHSMRYFFRPELEFYLKKAGFELIDNLDCATLSETSFDSWTSYFIAKAV